MKTEQEEKEVWEGSRGKRKEENLKIERRND